MPSFKDIALPMVERGVPITPIIPGTKRAFLPDFPNTASTDLQQIEEWNKLYPNHGLGCVALAKDGGVWFFEVDSPDVYPRILRDTGHDILSEIKTFRVSSREDRTHFYFRHNEISKALGNISQSYVLGQDWSVRTNREYVVGPGSIHPETGQPYKVIDYSPIVEAPKWLTDWMVSQRIKSSNGNGKEPPRNSNGKIPHGAIHGFMLTQAGKLRAMGLNQESIETALLQLVHDNCEPPIDDNKVRQMAQSICNYEPSERPLILNQQPSPLIISAPSVPALEAEEINFDEVQYPVFPKWVMRGTSIYEGYVKPYCERNSRIDYFMWISTAALMMNYLGNKVQIPLKDWKPSFYIVLIGEKGRANKSSSIKDAMQYLEFAGVLQMYSKDIRNADGRTIVWEAGSPEGLGIDMQRINCKNAVLFYDELQSLVAKVRIDGSGLSGALLKLYESASFANTIKSKKDTFSIAPNTYCASVLTATTDKKFIELWSKLAGEDTGLNDRFTFILQPEQLPEQRLQEVVNYHDAARETRKRIDKAVNQQTYTFFDQEPFYEVLKNYGNRAQIRAEKWALYFAIDLGLDEIDEDCVERGVAMAQYEATVKKHLMTYEAKNDEANIQQATIRVLKKNHGTIGIRELERELRSARYGTTIWERSLRGLMLSGYVSINPASKKITLIKDMFLGD